jgi:hypothetical protein
VLELGPGLSREQRVAGAAALLEDAARELVDGQ